MSRLNADAVDRILGTERRDAVPEESIGEYIAERIGQRASELRQRVPANLGDIDEIIKQVATHFNARIVSLEQRLAVLEREAATRRRQFLVENGRPIDQQELSKILYGDDIEHMLTGGLKQPVQFTDSHRVGENLVTTGSSEGGTPVI